jgi:Ca-activated chloride channel family protein
MLQKTRHRLALALLLAVIGGLFAGVAPAAQPGEGQTGKQSQEDDSAVFRTSVDVVNILCTVRRKDRYVQNLTRNDFEIYEDGTRQQIRYFTLESGENAQPLNIILLVDTSGSVKDKLMFEQDAANAFLEETLRPDKDMAAVVQFDSEINLVQDFTFSLDALKSAIVDIRAGGATKLYDAIWVSVQELLRHEVGRRVLVILSDGDDTQSVKKDDDAIKAAQDFDAVIFGIGVRGGRFRSNFGKLKQFARETGGLFFNSKASIDDLREAFSEINAAIKSQYSIGYVSTNQAHDGSFREIEVRVKGRDLKVSNRKGYYAPKPENGS